MRGEKTALRAQVKRVLRQLPADWRRRESSNVCRQIGPALPQDKPVLLYAAKDDELDLADLLQSRWASGAPVVLPKVAGETLTLHLVTQADALEVGKWGLLEPGPGCPEVTPGEIAAAVVPGRAFDAQGGRLGRGGGFYDRILGLLPPQADRWGVALTPQICAHVPMEDHDQRLTGVVTETGWVLAPSDAPGQQRLLSLTPAPEQTWIFDLDGTLFDTAPRHLAILRRFVETHKPTWSHLIEGFRPKDFRWDVDDPLRVFGVLSEEERSALMDYWFTRYFHSDALVHDVPVAGALSFVRRVDAAGARVVYLTARPAPTMQQGTIAQLQRWKLPLGESAQLMMKPSLEMKDGVYKQEAVKALYERGDVVASFENEPGNAAIFLSHFPSAAHFLLRTHHCPQAPSLPEGVVELNRFHEKSAL